MTKLIKYFKDLPKNIRYEFLRQHDEYELESIHFMYKGKMVKGTFFNMNGTQYLVVYNEDQLYNETPLLNNDSLNTDNISDIMNV